jgi:LysR family cys regulon transcriptional activator
MKLRTLECFCEVAANGFSFSRAARTLHATQPAISRQIQLLETELGFAVFERRGSRVFRLTSAGEVIFDRAQKILASTRELSQVEPELHSGEGTLTIATTDFNARYTLLPVLKTFRAMRPRIALSILSVDPARVAELVTAGEADLGLCTAPRDMTTKLTYHKCFDVERVVIVPDRHPLTREKRLTLSKIAAHPLILYDSRLSGGRIVMDAFHDRGIKVQVALRASTTDCIKAYVADGMGVGVIQALAFDRKKDINLRALDAAKLFGTTPVFLLLRKNTAPGGFLGEFTALLGVQPAG